MNNRFIRIGDEVFAINHIVHAYRCADGDVEVYLAGQQDAVRLCASTGEAQAFWDWQASALNTTTLHVKQEATLV